MKFYVNGKIFENENEAKEYEAKLEAEEQRKKEEKRQEERDLNEIKKIEEQYSEKVEAFCKKYGYFKTDLKATPFMSKIDKIFYNMFNAFKD